MGWTDDSDEEGLIEENPFIFVYIGVAFLVVISALHFVGLSYNPEWFEGQNLLSSMGIILFIMGIVAIGVSTFTGKSDLVMWEAMFLFGAVIMILIGNDFDFSGMMAAFASELEALGGVSLSKILMALVIIIGVAIAFAVGTGKKVGIGAAAVLLALIAVIGFINMWNAGTFDDFGTAVETEGWAYAAGLVLSDFTGGLADGAAGKAIGFGCLVIGLLLVIIPNWSTPIGVLLLIIGVGITGNWLWNDFGKGWFSALKGEKGGTEQFKASAMLAGAVGGPLGLFWFAKLYPPWLR